MENLLESNSVKIFLGIMALVRIGLEYFPPLMPIKQKMVGLYPAASKVHHFGLVLAFVYLLTLI